jgi:Ni/Co efflux regulator RcnB
MKSLVKAVALVALVAAPLVSFAQSSQPVTRAEVREQLAQLEQAGYNPNDWMHYPANIQHAEEVVAQQNAGNTAYGGAANGTSQAGK